jgi:hypothetical protein
MEKNFTQQEILLMTGSTFFQQQCFEKTEQDSNKNLSQQEKMVEACWNGILHELLPDIINKDADGKALMLWQITPHRSFLEIELCEKPAASDRYYSIDPYVFLQESFDN